MIELIFALFMALASPAQKVYHTSGGTGTQIQAQDDGSGNDDGGDDGGDKGNAPPPPPPPPPGS